MSTAAQTRATGWYWVNFSGRWELAQYVSEMQYWALVADEKRFVDEDFYEIDERRIERQP